MLNKEIVSISITKTFLLRRHIERNFQKCLSIFLEKHLGYLTFEPSYVHDCLNRVLLYIKWNMEAKWVKFSSAWKCFALSRVLCTLCEISNLLLMWNFVRWWISIMRYVTWCFGRAEKSSHFYQCMLLVQVLLESSLASSGRGEYTYQGLLM